MLNKTWGHRNDDKLSLVILITSLKNKDLFCGQKGWLPLLFLMPYLILDLRETQTKPYISRVETCSWNHFHIAIPSGGKKKKKIVNFPEVVLFNSLVSSKNHMVLLGEKKMEQGKLHSFPKNYKV